MKPTPYTVPLRNQIARPFLRGGIRGLLYLLSRVHITGVGNVPRRGAYLVATNHVSLFEAPLIMSCWPQTLEAIGAAEIWERPGQGILVRMYGAIPVHRGEIEPGLIEKMIAILKSGRSLAIAPEGGRSHQPGMRRAHPGVAYVIDKAGVPVVPIGIVGTTDDFLERALRWERPTVEMRIGQPLTFAPIASKGAARRAALQENTDIIMKQIAALLPFEYRGVYAEGNPSASGEGSPA